MDIKTIKLSNSDKITMKAPTVRVLKNAMNKSDKEMDQTIFMIASLTNKQEGEIEDLNLKDFAELQKALKSFLEEAGLTA